MSIAGWSNGRNVLILGVYSATMCYQNNHLKSHSDPDADQSLVDGYGYKAKYLA